MFLHEGMLEDSGHLNPKALIEAVYIASQIGTHSVPFQASLHPETLNPKPAITLAMICAPVQVLHSPVPLCSPAAVLNCCTKLTRAARKGRNA